jgi:hypothetical protein
MADESENLVLELLRAMRAEQQAMRADMAAMKTTQAATDAKLDRVVTDQTAMRADMAAMKAAQAATDGKIDRVESKIDRVLDRVNDVMAGQVRIQTAAENQDITQLRRDVDELTARVEAIEERNKDH